MKRLLLTITVALLFAQSALAAHKTVNCEITTGNEVVYKGKCDFIPDQGGTFSLSNIDQDKPLFEHVMMITVYITGKGTAQVRGLTTSANNSLWGDAKRSPKDKACWVGEDFKICAR